MNERDSYDDIINLPRRQSSAHPPMPRRNRAAQFSPFAALTGHEEAIRERARLTEQKAELSDAEKVLLTARLRLLEQHLPAKPKIAVTYFVPDPRKAGGAYVTECGPAVKICAGERAITVGQKAIHLDDIVALEGELFETP